MAKGKGSRKPSAAQLANQRRFAAMARARASGRGGGSSVVVIEKGKSKGGGKSKAALAVTSVAVPAKATVMAFNGRAQSGFSAANSPGTTAGGTYYPGYVGMRQGGHSRSRALVHAANAAVYEIAGFWPGLGRVEDQPYVRWHDHTRSKTTGWHFDLYRPAENVLIGAGAKLGHVAAQKYGINRGVRNLQSWVGIDRPVVI